MKKQVKVVKENVGELLYNLIEGEAFPSKTQNVEYMKEKIHKFDYLRMFKNLQSKKNFIINQFFSKLETRFYILYYTIILYMKCMSG